VSKHDEADLEDFHWNSTNTY